MLCGYDECSAKSGALVSRLRATDGSQCSDLTCRVGDTTAARSHESENAQAMNDAPFLHHAFVVVQHLLPCFSPTRYPGESQAKSSVYSLHLGM